MWLLFPPSTPHFYTLSRWDYLIAITATLFAPNLHFILPYFTASFCVPRLPQRYLISLLFSHYRLQLLLLIIPAVSCSGISQLLHPLVVLTVFFQLFSILIIPRSVIFIIYENFLPRYAFSLIAAVCCLFKKLHFFSH